MAPAGENQEVGDKQFVAYHLLDICCSVILACRQGPICNGRRSVISDDGSEG